MAKKTTHRATLSLLKGYVEDQLAMSEGVSPCCTPVCCVRPAYIWVAGDANYDNMSFVRAQQQGNAPSECNQLQ